MSVVWMTFRLVERVLIRCKTMGIFCNNSFFLFIPTSEHIKKWRSKSLKSLWCKEFQQAPNGLSQLHLKALANGKNKYIWLGWIKSRLNWCIVNKVVCGCFGFQKWCWHTSKQFRMENKTKQISLKPTVACKIQCTVYVYTLKKFFSYFIR